MSSIVCPRKLLVAAACCTAALVVLGPAAEEPRLLQASPQRVGDAERGFRYMVEGDYVRSGPPLVWFVRDAPLKESGFQRDGANAYLPYWLTATAAPSGAAVATPNCLHCHAQRLEG